MIRFWHYYTYHKTAMTQASLAESYWIKTKAASLTLATSVKALWLTSRFKNASQTDLNNLVNQWANQLTQIVKAKPKVDNPHNVELSANKRYIIMCNHSSLYDIPLTYFAFPNTNIRMLAKKELSRIPIFGSAMKNCGFPFIDRKNRKQAIKDLEKAKLLMDKGMVLWIAPEGTRSKNGKLQDFKKGAFITAIEAQATIIPLAIKGSFEISPHGSSCMNTEQEVILKIGQPIETNTYTLEQKDDLRSKTHQVFNELLK